jgi:hypothetical protein
MWEQQDDSLCPDCGCGIAKSISGFGCIAIFPLHVEFAFRAKSAGLSPLAARLSLLRG